MNPTTCGAERRSAVSLCKFSVVKSFFYKVSEIHEESKMSIGLILLIILILALVGVIPAWPHSRGWGYGPSGGVGLILVIILILFLLGRI